jgi:hypothetical protein
MLASLGNLGGLLLNDNHLITIEKDSFKDFSLINKIDLSGNQFENLNDKILKSLQKEPKKLIKFFYC